MPKMKTHRGAAKRFKSTSTGKVMRRKAFKNHILEKKSPKRKRNLSNEAEVTGGDRDRMKRLLGLCPDAPVPPPTSERSLRWPGSRPPSTARSAAAPRSSAPRATTATR